MAAALDPCARRAARRRGRAFRCAEPWRGRAGTTPSDPRTFHGHQGATATSIRRGIVMKNDGLIVLRSAIVRVALHALGDAAKNMIRDSFQEGEAGSLISSGAWSDWRPVDHSRFVCGGDIFDGGQRRAGRSIIMLARIVGLSGVRSASDIHRALRRALEAVFSFSDQFLSSSRPGGA